MGNDKSISGSKVLSKGGCQDERAFYYGLFVIPFLKCADLLSIPSPATFISLIGRQRAHTLCKLFSHALGMRVRCYLVIRYCISNFSRVEVDGKQNIV